MSNPEFKNGDVVQLKSGGPKMTVAEAEPRLAWCSWFAGNEHKSGQFYHHTLELYRAPKTKTLGI